MGKKTWVELQLKPILFTYGITRRKLQDDFLDKFARKIQDNVADQIAGYDKQVVFDAFAIALHEEFGFGTDRWKKLKESVEEVLQQIDITSMEETIDNLKNKNFEENGRTDVPILKSRVDGRVKPIYGDTFKEYDVRYKESQVNEKSHGWEKARSVLGEWGMFEW